MFHGIQQAEAGFRKAGVQAGDIVSAVAISVPETIYTFYALNKIGAVSNWIDPRKRIEEVKRNIFMTGSKLCLVQNIFWEQLGGGLLEIPEVTLILVSLKDSMPVMLKWLMSLKMVHVPKSKRLFQYSEFIQGKSVRPLEESTYTKNVPAILEYTGGTTGTPKAVMLSNENVNSVVVQYQICSAPMARSHTWLSVAFPFTAYALICSHHLPLSLGMKFTPTVGADKISAEGEKRVNEFLEAHGCRYKLAKGYGMTEVASGVTFTPTNEVNKLGSVGIPFSHITVGIFDLDSGEELPCGKQGEICIAGPSVMLGYYQNEKATTEVKGIERCCAVGVRDKDHKVGQVAVAFVKAESEQNSMRERIYGVCQALLPEYSCPKEIYFVRELPYTAAGKIDFQVLQAMAAERERNG